MKQVQTQKFRDLLKDFDTAVLITHGDETHFCARPMVIARVDDNCDLWFIKDEDSVKVHEIETDTPVHVLCQSERASCVSISGHASLSRDLAKIHELWQPAYKVWYPQGADDPNIVLIHVTGEYGEYWDYTGANRFAYLYRPIETVVTRTTPEIAEGEQHGSMSLAYERCWG